MPAHRSDNQWRLPEVEAPRIHARALPSPPARHARPAKHRGGRRRLQRPSFRGTQAEARYCKVTGAMPPLLGPEALVQSRTRLCSCRLRTGERNPLPASSCTLSPLPPVNFCRDLLGTSPRLAEAPPRAGIRRQQHGAAVCCPARAWRERHGRKGCRCGAVALILSRTIERVRRIGREVTRIERAVKRTERGRDLMVWMVCLGASAQQQLQNLHIA